MSDSQGFSDEQKNFLQGFAIGSDVARKVSGLPVLSGSGSGETVTVGTSAAPRAAGELPVDPAEAHIDAQDEQVAKGGKLVGEEKAKRDKPAQDLWDDMRAWVAAGEFPKGTDVFLTKFYGMFYVAPAQDSYMCRLRFPGGALKSWQMRGLAEMADKYAGGYTDVTTRGNLQFREIKAEDPINVILGLRDLGIINYGSGADNIRNVTASPLSGVDSNELIETLPLARDMHYYIIQHREMYGLPRKFNIAFDGGGTVSALEDTNDIGFTAVEASADDLPKGVYFQLTLGGITGHKDFARPTGVLLEPHECVDVAGAIVKVFIKSGDRTNRNKARLKYVLDDWGFDKYLEEVEKELGRTLRRVPLDACEPRRSDDRQGHVGIHPQSQEGLNYVGVALPVGRLTSDQMHSLAAIADKWGNGDLRLTVWQNVIIPNIADEHLDEVKRMIESIDLDWNANSVRAGLIACTGSAGCKYAAAPTKANALTIADYVEERIELDSPVNIHVTGCHHSCAQHYIGDIGLISANVENPEDPDGDTVEGYHLFVGGGYGTRQAIARELFTGLPFTEVPSKVASLLQTYLDNRVSEEETFVEFASRIDTENLKQLCLIEAVPA